MNAKWHIEGREFCEHALRTLPQDDGLNAVLSELDKQRAQRSRSRQGCLSEKEAHALEVQDFVGHEELARMRAQIETMSLMQPSKLRELERVAGPMPPKFDAAFLSRRGLPPACDGPSCRNVIAQAAGDAFGSWMTTAVGSKSDEVLDPVGGVTNSGIHEGKLLVRLRDLDRVSWWSRAQVGDVDFSHRQPYHSGVEQLATFCNVVQRALPVAPGGVHVAVGFVDLGELAETISAWLLGGTSAGDCNLKWVGIDASAHACARTAVLVRMLQQGSSCDSVMQVRSISRVSWPREKDKVA